MTIYETLFLFWTPVFLGLLFLLWVEWMNACWEVGEAVSDELKPVAQMVERAARFLRIARRERVERERVEAVLEAVLAAALYLLIASAYWNLLAENHWVRQFLEIWPLRMFLFVLFAPLMAYWSAEGVVALFLDARERWREAARGGTGE